MSSAALRDAFARPGRIGARPLLQRQVYVYRRSWAELVAAVVEPLMYLLTLGVGLGKLVGHAPGLPNVSYAAYVAPGLLAMAVMNAATNETLFGAFSRLRMEKLYDVVIATPMSIGELARGELWWATIRGVLAGSGFLAVMLAFGLVHSGWAVLIVPACTLVALAFAAAGLIVATYIRDFNDFQWVQLVMLPMFLFATTFYPLSVYPRAVQIAVECLPLYHSINLMREPALGTLGSGAAVALVYLAVMTVACWWFAVRRLRRVLIR
ncbi:MAG: lipooligosaccharide transport system permease protein [Gaiellaceae bacterium]|nr:lipooligosaccharide transport system permease protein [Gaiellaceae bacterium]